MNHTMEKHDIPHTFHFINRDHKKFCILNKDGLQFIPQDICCNKKDLAVSLVLCLEDLWSTHCADKNHVLDFKLDCGDGNPVVLMKLTDEEIVIDDPLKPFDWWTLKIAKSLWKSLKKQ